MIIGIPKEIKENEYRIACTPAGAREIVNAGARLLIEKGAGKNAGFPDSEYEIAGAEILDTAKEVYENSDLIYKVKEVLPEEFDLLKEEQILLTYIHSNADIPQTDILLEKNITAIAYEDIDNEEGEFPLLKPMSIIAGYGGFIAALEYSQKINGGPGLLLADLPGIERPHITIIGAGNSGLAAARAAAGFGCDITILDNNISILENLQGHLPPNISLVLSNETNLLNEIRRTDVLINCILWPKDRKDHLISREMLSEFKSDAIIVDVSCDEAGAIETSRATSHDNPIYEVDGIIHYAVDNIPSAFAQTASQSMNDATVPFVINMINNGVIETLRNDKYLRRGLTTYSGLLTLEETALKQNRDYTPPEIALE